MSDQEPPAEEKKEKKTEKVVVDPEIPSGVGRFFLEVPYVYLVNPDLLPKKKLLEFPIPRVLLEFYGKMQQEEKLDFKILGLALQSSARLHKQKVSTAISFEKKLDEEFETRRQKGEFVYDRPLKQYLTRPELSFTSETAANAFYDQLLVSLRQDEETKRRRTKKQLMLEVPEGMDGAEKDEVIQEDGKRRRRIRFKELSVFDSITIDFDRIEIDVIINEVLGTIRELSKGFFRAKLVPFVEITRERVKAKNDPENMERWKLEQVRVLMSLLYLVKEEFVEAWQDLENFEISVKITKKGMNETFGFKDKREFGKKDEKKNDKKESVKEEPNAPESPKKTEPVKKVEPPKKIEPAKKVESPKKEEPKKDEKK